MSNEWYPVIEYSKCVSCMTCSGFCPHNVYDETDGKPAVARPENCVDLCKGCSKICPEKAISFHGDNNDK